jgi:hypothetical protein
VAEGEAKAQAVGQIAAQLPAKAWQRYPIQEGSKGPIEAQFALVRSHPSSSRPPWSTSVGGFSS